MPTSSAPFRRRVHLLTLTAALLCLLPALAAAQTDEIQVYDASIAPQGVFNLTWHNNFIADGSETPAFPGALVPNHSFNGVTEWAYGVKPWFEAGLYLPLYSISQGRGATYNGFKLRALFVVPHAADRHFVYGANFEFSVNTNHWDPKRYTSEVRPIIGWHLHPVDIIINPILDTSYDGLRNLDFAPSTRVAWNLSPIWAVAAEEYDDFGPIHEFNPVRNQGHQLYAVVDRDSKLLSIEAGIGFGLNAGSDPVTLKLILSRDLN
jgi:hypothetical protein